MNEKDQYKALISEVIAKEIIILGPDIAVMKARTVSSLTITDGGTVSEITGNPADALQDLIDVYVALSGQIVKSALTSVFTKYPSLKQVE